MEHVRKRRRAALMPFKRTSLWLPVRSFFMGDHERCGWCFRRNSLKVCEWVWQTIFVSVCLHACLWLFGSQISQTHAAMAIEVGAWRTYR
jgi:hypothetical protein